MVHFLPLALGLLLLAAVALDAFQTIILPRRPAGRFRLTRMFFLATWGPWTAITSRVPSRRVRDQLYSIYGPLALLLLMAGWALLLVVAYGLVLYGSGARFTNSVEPGTIVGLQRCIYVSGTTLFTLGLGDITPASPLSRLLLILEAGTGLGYVALVIGYVPVLYTSFSRREVTIALLDARAGSPPTAGELLLRHNFSGGHQALTELLAEWERWSAEMLESHISYPILCYYRSQHDNQSWISAITSILDTCALLITTVEGPSTRQAQLTFAIARHTLVDLGHVFHRDPDIQRLIAEAQQPGAPSRLPAEEFQRLCEVLGVAGFALCDSADTQQRLAKIRQLYEPQARVLADYLRLSLPLWLQEAGTGPAKSDQWTTIANLRNRAAARDRLVQVKGQDKAPQYEDLHL